ncbi:hypothetical protein [Saccharopolyspora phatthalungensis]|uniref:Uncharacterized protein n=1 Tax=Saccharopolyspora phatthalungensis TaxID=664693 RepID=A0A840QKK9_9PSEU|nr:hypothetical protein [Saccharopolyspora phatthalungensis]MBB5159033.1 hypothetical protein [Saccharopolyspora phatthalungensis]
MSTFLWWIGDGILILVVFPIAVLLLLRIIRGLSAANRAIVSIGSLSREITQSLPQAVGEISAMAETADALRRD